MKRIKIFALAVVLGPSATGLALIGGGMARGPLEPTDTSLSQYQNPEWFPGCQIWNLVLLRSPGLTGTRQWVRSDNVLGRP